MSDPAVAVALPSHAVTTLDSAPRSPARAAAYVSSPSGIYTVVVAVFCGLLLISNVAATKLITVLDGLPAFLGGGIFTDGGALLFPLTYILGDVLAEVYGLRQARRAIWVGYLAGQFLNAYVLVRLKQRTAERGLAGRLVTSTVVGEFAETALFCLIAFVGVFPSWGSLIGYTITGYLYKVAIEVILLPVTFAVIRAI